MSTTAHPTTIPLAGTVLEGLERRGTWLVASLRGEGAGRVQLLFFNGDAHGTVAALPLTLAGGSLDSSEGSLGDGIPLPLERPGAVELHLQGVAGELLTIVGQSLTVRAADPEPSIVTLGRPARVG